VCTCGEEVSGEEEMEEEKVSMCVGRRRRR
jgi:hypothetical protein